VSSVSRAGRLLQYSAEVTVISTPARGSVSLAIERISNEH
jgi:hypothetical protein